MTTNTLRVTVMQPTGIHGGVFCSSSYKDHPRPRKIYAWGGCYFAGTRRACGAYGVYVSENHPDNAGCFSKSPSLTNQIMQLLAIRAAMTVLQKYAEREGIGTQRLSGGPLPGGGGEEYGEREASEQEEEKDVPVVVTTSAYFAKLLHKWSAIWERTGWLTKNSKPVKNLVLLQDMIALVNETGAQSRLVKSIECCEGLQHAKTLADQAAAEGGRIGCKFNSCTTSSAHLLGCQVT